MSASGGAEPTSPFTLQRYEAQIPGVRYRDGVLRLRPTWAAVALDAGQIGAAALFAVVAIGTHNVFFAIAGIILALMPLPYLRCRVVCTGETVRIVNKWHIVVLEVSKIATADQHEFEPTSFLPFLGPTSWPRWRLTSCDVVLRDGHRHRCDALVGLLNDNQPPSERPIELKAAILRRWIQAAAASRPAPAT